MNRFIIALLLVGCLSQHTFAQPPAGDANIGDEALIDDRPPPKKLLLFPAAEPRIAFEHHLLPRENELQEGDAAAFYGKAIQIYSEKRPAIDTLYNEVTEEMEKPIAQFPIVKAKKLLVDARQCIEYTRYASVRKNCSWPIPYKDHKDRIVDVILPEMNSVRQLSWLLAIEARVALYENRPIDALDSIKTSYAMARHVNKGYFLIQGLVSCAIVGIANGQLWDVMQHPDCPNLYWPLTELPQPLLDAQRSLEYEFDIVFNLVPELKKIGKEKLTQEEYTSIFLKTMTSVRRMAGEMRGNDKLMMDRIAKSADLNTLMAVYYATARTKLLEAGYSAEKINEMGTAEAILVQMVDANKYIRSEISKFSYLPEGELALFNEQGDAQKFAKLETFPFASLLLPAARSARIAYVRKSRELAALRTYEAIRIHASKTGSLPNELNEIKAVPVPNDPITGKPFEYSIQSKKSIAQRNVQDEVRAMLTASNHLKSLNPFDDLRFEITFVNNKEQFNKQLAADKVAYQAKLAAMPPKVAGGDVEQAKAPDPRDDEAVAAKDQKYYEPNPDKNAEGAVKQPYAAMHKQSFDNMKQIGLAMNMQISKSKAFPPAYIAEKNGKPLLSWRVMILPYIEQQALYEKFKLDEPWDSEHNKKLIEKMPKVYASPLTKPLGNGKTCYLVPFGKETIFTGAVGTKIRQVPDGMSKTVVVVEAAPESAVEWTKPQDWEFDSSAKEPFKGLFGLRESGVIVGYADGSVRLVPPTVTRGAMKGMITKAGGENYDIDKVGK